MSHAENSGQFYYNLKRMQDSCKCPANKNYLSCQNKKKMVDVPQDLSDLTITAEKTKFKTDVFYVIIDLLISKINNLR